MPPPYTKTLPDVCLEGFVFVVGDTGFEPVTSTV